MTACRALLARALLAGLLLPAVLCAPPSCAWGVYASRLLRGLLGSGGLLLSPAGALRRGAAGADPAPRAPCRRTSGARGGSGGRLRVIGREDPGRRVIVCLNLQERERAAARWRDAARCMNEIARLCSPAGARQAARAPPAEGGPLIELMSVAASRGRPQSSRACTLTGPPRVCMATGEGPRTDARPPQRPMDGWSNRKRGHERPRQRRESGNENLPRANASGTCRSVALQHLARLWRERFSPGVRAYPVSSCPTSLTSPRAPAHRRARCHKGLTGRGPSPKMDSAERGRAAR